MDFPHHRKDLLDHLVLDGPGVVLGLCLAALLAHLFFG